MISGMEREWNIGMTNFDDDLELAGYMQRLCHGVPVILKGRC